MVKLSNVAPLCALLAVGCTTADPDDAGVELTGKSSLALMQLERHLDGEADVRLTAGAKIAQYRGIEGEGLLRLLGADARDLETCGTTLGAEELSVGPQAHVELLSVGDVTLRVGGARHQLGPRLFPALATTAAGWFYAGALDAAELEGEEYELSAPGERGIGRFAVTIPAPAEVQGLLGIDLSGDGPLLRDHDLELTWEPEGHEGERVEIEIYSGGAMLACALRDDGQFVIPAPRVRGLDADENASLVVRRVRFVPVDMAGVDVAYARVATTRFYPLRVR